MTGPDKKTEQQQWREAAGRAMALWRGTVGGTYDTLTSELRVGLAATSLAQSLRPRGRRPRQASDMLADIARVLAEKLADRRPDMTSVQFEEAMRKHIVGGAPSPLDKPSPEAPAPSPHRSAGISPALFTFDLWTPGQSPEAIIREFAPHIGSEGAEMLTSMSREATESIGAGDFARQLDIAEQAIRLGDDAPKTPLRGEGLYLKAEALRLMADFEADRSKVRDLRRDAERLYAEAEDALRGDPRPIRGRARTLEVLGDLDEAMTEFDRAIAAVEARGSSIREHDHLSMTHERVRSLRHKMNCLAAMHAEHPLATAHAQRRGEQIRRLIAASEPEHEEALQLLRANESWWQIEWFMAQVLHAKAWSSVKEDGKAAKRLEWSLDIRLKMMASDGRLSPVEQGNLHWWIGIARGARGAFEASQQSALEDLKSALDRGESRAIVKALGQAFITAGAAPWKSHKPQT